MRLIAVLFLVLSLLTVSLIADEEPELTEVEKDYVNLIRKGIVSTMHHGEVFIFRIQKTQREYEQDVFNWSLRQAQGMRNGGPPGFWIEPKPKPYHQYRYSWPEGSVHWVKVDFDDDYKPKWKVYIVSNYIYDDLIVGDEVASLYERRAINIGIIKWNPEVHTEGQPDEDRSDERHTPTTQVVEGSGR